MCPAPRLPDTRAGPSVHLRVPGSLLQPAAPALVAGLPLTDGVRAPAGRYLTLSHLHETGARSLAPIAKSQQGCVRKVGRPGESTSSLVSGHEGTCICRGELLVPLFNPHLSSWERSATLVCYKLCGYWDTGASFAL